MTCRQLVDFIDDYIDNKLAPAERTLFEKHLSICPECVRYLNDYRTTVHLARTAVATDPADLPSGLRDAIRKAMKE